MSRSNDDLGAFGLPITLVDRTLSAMTAIWSRSQGKVGPIWKEMKAGEFHSANFFKSSAELTELWARNMCDLWELPYDVWAAGSVPSLLITADADSEAPTEVVHLRAILDDSTNVRAGKFVKIGGGGGRLPRISDVTRSGRTLTISVSLHDPVDPDAPDAEVAKSPPGHYVSPVYAEGPGRPVPLAMVHLVIVKKGQDAAAEE